MQLDLFLKTCKNP